MIYSFIYWTERSTALLCASQRSFYMFCVCVNVHGYVSFSYGSFRLQAEM